MDALAKTGDACTCDQPGSSSDDKLRKLFRLVATLKEDKYQAAAPPTTFWLGIPYGALLWGMLGNLLVIWLVKIFCMVSQIDGFKRALCQIKLFQCMNGLLRDRELAAGAKSGRDEADPSDIQEGAAAVAAGLAGINVNGEKRSIQQKEAEIRCRKKMMLLFSAALKRDTDADELPTHCDTTLISMPTAQCQGVNLTSSTDFSPPAPPDTNSTLCIPLDIRLPRSTLTTNQKEELFSSTKRILGQLSHNGNLEIRTGSTFLSATVYVDQNSGMDDLLHRAARLLEMGRRFDPACTVQLGASALLYKPSGNTMKTILLEQGVYDVPIITSVQRFYTQTIMIKGFYLKDAEMKASISLTKSVRLNILYYQQLDEGLEVLFAQLPQDESFGKKTLIYANKNVHIEGYENSLVLRSMDKELCIQKYQPTILDTFCTRQIWITLSVLFFYNVVVMNPWGKAYTEWAFELVALILSLLFVEYNLGPWTFYVITRCLQYTIKCTNLDNIHILKEMLKMNEKVFERCFKSSNKNMAIPINTRISENTSKHDDDTDSTESKEADDGTASTNNEDAGDVNKTNWEWPCYSRFLGPGRWVKVKVKADRVDQSSKKPIFEVVKTLNPDHRVKIIELFVHSPLLIKVLEECDPKTNVHFREGSAIDPKEIFYRREALTAYVDQNSARMNISGDNVQISTAVCHVKHVLRFMERHFAEVLENYECMKAEGCVSYDMLWAFFIPGDGVCRRCLQTNQECFATVRDPAFYNHSCMTITLNVMDFNVRSYSKCTMSYNLGSFQGKVPFTSLQVCPLHFFPNRKDMERRFIIMGNIFYQVAMVQPFCFREMKGSINFYKQDSDGCMRLHKLNADGRVMIDLLSFARMNPDYPLGNAEPPCEVMVGAWRPEAGQMKKPSDKELMMAPAFAYGFSFRVKKWGCFELCGLREIEFSEGAFTALMMKNQNQKDILGRVVQEYTADESGMQSDNEDVDVIANKGRGCIVLLHGPPGTGKTLTAEALAEAVRCPLWSISAFELGDEAETVEKTLGQILEIAHIWRAILLLDEADAYLERRVEGVDVKRNLLTGVFLRMLEYYRGIMFVTTNRVTAFDDAILSRITLAISYPPLDDEQRRAIWEKLLQRHIVCDDASLRPLARHHHLNGREIRNIVHIAQIFARADRRRLQMTDVSNALDAFMAGTTDLPHQL